VIARYDACGVCIKVCPIQRYGLKAVMDHYAVTGQVLGKGTHNLEGYELPHGTGYFAPGELPKFPHGFFDVPEGSADQYLFKELKEKIQKGEVPEGEEGEEVWQEFRTALEGAVRGPTDVIAAGYGMVEGVDPL
jgi:ferredoxin